MTVKSSTQHARSVKDKGDLTTRKKIKVKARRVNVIEQHFFLVIKLKGIASKLKKCKLSLDQLKS